MLQADAWAGAAQVGLVWLLALAASATAGYLIANAILAEGEADR
jgi:multicomponent Na+:H+ antiporter subunit G